MERGKKKGNKILAWFFRILAVAIIIPGQVLFAKYAVIMPFRIFIMARTMGAEKLADILIGALIILVGCSLIVGLGMMLVLLLVWLNRIRTGKDSMTPIRLREEEKRIRPERQLSWRRSWQSSPPGRKILNTRRLGQNAKPRRIRMMFRSQ